MANSKALLTKGKSVLITLDAQRLGQLRWTAVEDSDLALLLCLQLLEDLIPIGSARIGAGFEASDEVPFALQKSCNVRVGLSWAKQVFITFSCSRSRASCSPTAFMSVRCSALVMYMCMSKKLARERTSVRISCCLDSLGLTAPWRLPAPPARSPAARAD